MLSLSINLEAEYALSIDFILLLITSFEHYNRLVYWAKDTKDFSLSAANLPDDGLMDTAGRQINIQS